MDATFWTAAVPVVAVVALAAIVELVGRSRATLYRALDEVVSA